jgi:hypothetical protein
MKSKPSNPTHDLKELLHMTHKWDDLNVGDFLTLLPSAYGEADDFFTPGQTYKILGMKSHPDSPNENQIAIKARDGRSYYLPYSHFNVEVKDSSG